MLCISLNCVFTAFILFLCAAMNLNLEFGANSITVDEGSTEGISFTLSSVNGEAITLGFDVVVALESSDDAPDQGELTLDL